VDVKNNTLLKRNTGISIIKIIMSFMVVVSHFGPDGTTEIQLFL